MGGHDRPLATQFGQADHGLKMWLKTLLMEDKRAKLKAGRGDLPYPKKYYIPKKSHGRETALSSEARLWPFTFDTKEPGQPDCAPY